MGPVLCPQRAPRQQRTESREVRAAEAQSWREHGARPGWDLSRAGTPTAARGGVFLISAILTPEASAGVLGGASPEAQSGAETGPCPADSVSSRKAGAPGPGWDRSFPRLVALGGGRHISNRAKGILGVAPGGEPPLPMEGSAWGPGPAPESQNPSCPEPEAAGFPICQEFN